MRGRPGENDGVETVEDPDGSDATTSGHGFAQQLTNRELREIERHSSAGSGNGDRSSTLRFGIR